MTNRPTIIKTTCGFFFRVTEPATADLAHCYLAVRVKRVRGEWVDAKGAAEQLIRKAGATVFPADAAEMIAV